MPEIVNLPVHYINGCVLSVTSNTTLNVTNGQLRDNTNTYDMVVSTPIAISSAAIGLNGLDTGTVGNNKLYNVFVISASNGFKATGAIISLSAIPVMPEGYDLIQQIGICITNGTAQFLPISQSGINSERSFVFATPLSILSAGVATTFTAISLLNFVPAINNTPITLIASYTPQAAGNAFNLRPTGSTSTTGLPQKGIVAAIEQDSQVTVLAMLSGGNASIDYKVGNAGDALSLSIYSIQLSL